MLTVRPGSSIAITWAFAGREWRAQRGFTMAVAGLMVFAAVATALGDPSLRPDADPYSRAHTVAAVIAVFLVGGSMLLAQRTVTFEHESPHGDQWVRRVGGSLWCAWLGKLTTMGLTSAAMTAVGIGTLWIMARDMHTLAAVLGDSHVRNATMIGLGCTPWVWAFSMWMPRGRMAWSLATLVAGSAWVITTCLTPAIAPGLEKTLAWRPWVVGWASAGPVVAAISWVFRRRGAWRGSLKAGALTSGVLLLPMAAWLGSEVWSFHRWTDADRVGYLLGVDGEGRFALVGLDRPSEWYGSDLIRLDLETGRFERLPRAYYEPAREVHHGLDGAVRFWHVYDLDDGRARVLDLRTGQLFPGYTSRPRLRLPPELLALAERSALEASPYRQHNGRAVWRTRDAVLFEEPDGSIRREPGFEEPIRSEAGEGWDLPFEKVYDFATAQVLKLPRSVGGKVAIDGAWYFVQCMDRPDLPAGWERQPMVRNPDGTMSALPTSIELILGKHGDAVRVWTKGGHSLFHPSDGSVEPILAQHSAHAGLHPGWNRDRGFAAYRDPASLAVTVLDGIKPAQLLPLPGGTAAAFDEHTRKILRLHPDGRRDVVHPR